MPPVRYTDDLEKAEPNEQATQRELCQVLGGIITTTAKSYGHGVRSVHAKSHALLQGMLTVKADLPPVLAQGLFRTPASYPVVMRISTIPGDILDDHVSVPRGLAIKVMNVPGDHLAWSDGAGTQDFLMVNGSASGAASASKFLGNLRLVAKTTDKAEWAKMALSYVMRRVARGLQLMGVKSALVSTLGGHPLTNPAGETYYSQTPFRYGDYVAKFSLAPASPNLIARKDVPVHMVGRRDGLRDELNRLFAHDGATWELRVQLLTDLNTMLIEDSSVAWPDDVSPYLTVATVVIHNQEAWSKVRASVGDDQLAFSPWHCLAAHRPMGSINRVRQEAYKVSADARSKINGCPIHEPREPIVLPSSV
jgi:hypothetical protein